MPIVILKNQQKYLTLVENGVNEGKNLNIPEKKARFKLLKVRSISSTFYYMCEGSGNSK